MNPVLSQAASGCVLLFSFFSFHIAKVEKQTTYDGRYVTFCQQSLHLCRNIKVHFDTYLSIALFNFSSSLQYAA